MPSFPPNDPRPSTSAHDGVDLDALVTALQAMRVGDFSVRLPANLSGQAGKIADVFNEIVV